MFYKAYGLGIKSDIKLPEFPPVSSGAGAHDVLIERGEVSVPKTEVIQTGPFTFTNGHDFWLNLPELVQFEVLCNGEIRYSIKSNLHEDTLRLLLLGLPLAAMLAMRGMVIFHGMAVAIEETPYIILGRRSLARAKVIERALHGELVILSENFVVFDLGLKIMLGNNRVEVPESFLKMPVKSPGFVLSSSRPLKRRYSYIEVEPGTQNNKFKASDAVFLGFSDRTHEMLDPFERIVGLGKIKLLKEHLYPSNVLHEIYSSQRLFEVLVSIGSSARVFRTQFDWLCAHTKLPDFLKLL